MNMDQGTYSGRRRSPEHATEYGGDSTYRAGRGDTLALIDPKDETAKKNQQRPIIRPGQGCTEPEYLARHPEISADLNARNIRQGADGVLRVTFILVTRRDVRSGSGHMLSLGRTRVPDGPPVMTSRSRAA